MVRSFYILLLFVISCSAENHLKDLSKNDLSNTIDAKAEESLKNYFKVHRSLQAQLTPEEWEKLRWLSKAMIVLRGGAGLKTSEDIKPYLKISKEDIASQLIENPEFIETLVQFNNYFLGFNISSVFEEDKISFEALRVPAAFSSAHEVSINGDYFELLNGTPAFLVGDLERSYFYNPDDGTFIEGEEAVKLNLDQLRKTLDELEQFLNTASDPINMANYCTQFAFKPYDFYPMGLPLPFDFTEKLKAPVFNGCNAAVSGLPYDTPSVQELRDNFSQFEENVEFFIDIVLRKAGKTIGKDLSKVDKIDLTSITPEYERNYFSSFAFSLQNSSTNYNRKRAAYVLDRFLCDNLLPIDVELPDQHSDDAHGSQPSCYACHYRLDPMAGFFKDYGLGFSSYKNQKKILFDDFAEIDKAEYDKSWMNESGSTRKWNIGVIRSEKDESKNFYGENLKDLFQILKKMPEVKKCITRRAFEFVTSEGQNVDQEYLSQVAEQFIETSKTSSARAIKNLFKSFVLSQTFIHKDPILSQCYDFPTGFDPAGAPPCEVRFILEKKCSSCHYPFGGEKGLDLTTWIKVEGDRYGFVHEPNGTQLSIDESFERIKEALSSSDPKKRMPYKQHMDPSDRETLYLWVEKQLTGE